MTQAWDLDNNTRLLIIVPHPDDETLATGGLIQIALAAGASLRVVIATDGDDNPWPQRWIEKRWRIDAEARQRWAQRRRIEAAEALARLGVSAGDIRHLGWPDQGLTGLLMRDAQCEDQLVAELVEFKPNLIVAPSLADRHPDHSALRMMLELAVARTVLASCRRLGFVVHGPMSDEQALAVTASAEQTRIKHHALQAHATQLVLSGKRMHGLCQRVERFEPLQTSASESSHPHRRDWQMPWPRSRIRLHPNALCVIVEVDGRIVRLSRLLSARSETTKIQVNSSNQPTIELHMQASIDTLRISLLTQKKIGRVFAKIERLGARVVIYDRHGWFDSQGAYR